MSIKLRFTLFAIFCAALSLRLGFLFSAEMHDPVLRADALKYAFIAMNLIEDGRYSFSMTPPLESSTLITPGYPFFLAVVYKMVGSLDEMFFTALIIQAIVSTLTVLLTFFLARLFVSDVVALVCMLLVAVYPHQVVVVSYLLTETLCTFLLLLGSYLICSNTGKQAVKAGGIGALVIGLAILTRPAVLLFLPFLFIVVLHHYQSVSRKILLCAGLSMLCWAPWMYWGSFHADQQESNVRTVATLGTYPDFTHKYFRGFPNREDPKFVEISRSWSSIATHIKTQFSTEPRKYLTWYLFDKPLSLWGWSVVQGQGGPFVYPVKSSPYDEMGIHRATYIGVEYLHKGLVWTGLITAGLVLVFGIFGFGYKPNVAAVYVASLVVYITLVHIPLATLPRFSIPFQPFLIMIAMFGLFGAWQRLRGRSL